MSSDRRSRRPWTACLALAAAGLACHSGGARSAGAGDDNVAAVRATGRTRVDLLFVIDNSGSMAQEQEAASRYFGRLLRALVDPPDDDGDGRPDAVPVEDLHVGVVSTDLGTMGLTVSTCRIPDGGDDGCLLHAPSGTVPDCATEYPTFLARDPLNATDYLPERLAADFACLATLGTNGCGFEQPLEAMRRAAAEHQGPGRCNEGFLRDDSVLALVVITDENDCSVAPDHPEIFDQDRTDMGHLGLRCFLHPEVARPVEWFRDRLLALRPRAAESVVLAELVGVPPDTVCEGDGARLAECLGLARMQETVDLLTPTQLVPSCNTSMGLALPPVRIVELARLWREAGGGTYVGSICRTDWTDAAEGIRRTIADRLEPECLPYELEPEALTDPDRADPSCAANCALVELLPEGRTCAGDPACPPEACPPTTLDEVLAGTTAPCRVSGEAETCEPSARDLGRVVLPGDARFRGCLVRQEPGVFDADLGRCVAPADASGWRYVPPAWNDGPGGPCPRAVLPPWLRRERDEGAVLRLYCGLLECPFDRQCGPPGQPAESCCAPGSFCARDAGTGVGSCLQPDR
ncbi:MAG: hypothetical protein JXB32_23690 [Deltaproteobacteria bacterium]|nr:hypothetical protein [Deltaproteobacteria bacterium]